MDYVSITRSEDLKDIKDKKLYRFLEVLPAGLSLVTLISAVLLSWLAPVVIAFFIIGFDIYWLLRVIYFSFNQLIAYGKMKKNLKVDWETKLDGLGKDWKDIYHLIVLPTYQETYEVLKESFESLKEVKYPRENLIVVLAIEESAGPEAIERAKRIEKEYSKYFFRFLISVHPKGLEGEMAGKGANLNYGANYAKEKVIDPLGISYDKVLLASFDSDTKAGEQYFLCLTYNFLIDESPLRTSYQPIPLYNNNIWNASAFSRVISVSGTFWQMIMQERPEKLVTYSSHSFPFRVFVDVGYPKDLVADDSHVFWKAYFFYGGDYKTRPLHYPVSMDAVMAPGLVQTAVNQYKQQRRWAWGCTEIPYVIFNFLKIKGIPFKEKFDHVFTLLEGFWSWANSALLIFFLGWLPLMIGGDKFNITMVSYSLPKITGLIMNISMAGIMISALTGLLLLPSKPGGVKLSKKIAMVVQWALIPFTLIVFGSIPSLDSQVRMMIKKPLGFWVTPKDR
jgi:cellulose synthase/poly-beta-1,6-N-acetylglucosamine synthase-like glycosyltransferase